MYQVYYVDPADVQATFFYMVGKVKMANKKV